MHKIVAPIPAGQVTSALHSMRAGLAGAEERLWSIVYPWLRARARALCARERRTDVTASDLVHEAYGRLRGAQLPRCNDRSHFVCIATRAMRQVLVDASRRRDRRSCVEQWSPERFHELADGAPLRRDEQLDVAVAIAEMANSRPRLASVVELRHYGGLSIAETARVLGMAERSVDLAWATARAWLRRRLT